MEKNRDIFQYDDLVGHTFLPNLKARIPHEAGGYLLATNAQGFRSSKNFAQEKKDAQKRVLVFGDSYTAGDGVSNKKRYTDLLEASDPNLDIFNFGISGTGTDQQYLAWQKYGRDIEADVVVISVLVENIRRIQSGYRKYEGSDGKFYWKAKPYFSLENGALKLHHTPVPKEPIPEDEAASMSGEGGLDRGGRYVALRKAVNMLGVKQLAQKISRFQPVPDYDNVDSAGWQLMRAILLDWIPQIKVPVILFPIPLYQHVEENASAENYQKRFSEVAAECNALLYDPLPELQTYSIEDRRDFRFKNDVHPTEFGHQVLAKCLENAVALT